MSDKAKPTNSGLAYDGKNPPPPTNYSKPAPPPPPPTGNRK